MGKKNRKLVPQKTIPVVHADSLRKCDWCQHKKEKGSMWEGQWVCSDCFPQEIVVKKIEQNLIPVRKCESCKDKTNNGSNINGRWICKNCEKYFQKTSKQHNNKYAHFSKVGNPVPSRVETISVVNNNKGKKSKARKNRHPKLIKIEYWKVVITDISDGNL